MRSKHAAVMLTLVFPALAFASTWRGPAAQAGDEVAKALHQTWRSPPFCRQAVGHRLAQVLDGVDGLTRHSRDDDVRALRDQLRDIGQAARNAGCPSPVRSALRGARRYLGRVADRLPDEAPEPPAPPPAPMAQIGPVSVAYGVRDGQGRNVRFAVSNIQLRNMPGARYALALTVRSANGGQSRVFRSPTWRVPNANFGRNAPYAFMVRYRALRRLGPNGGAFVAHVALLDGQNREIASREVPFTVDLHPRRCGPGMDPGCQMQREGHQAMNARAFQSLLASVSAQRGDVARGQMARRLLSADWVTAMQLGRLLDLFHSELIAVEVGKTAAPHTVDPRNAMGLARRFQNATLRDEFARTMAAQR